MAAKKSPDAVAEQPAIEDHDDTQLAAALPSNWEFVDRTPTRADVMRLLIELEPVWGVAVKDFIDYIQALPQKKKVKAPHPDRPDLMVDKFIENFSLYMSVGGRQQMLRRAQEAHGWRVDYRPEPITPTGVPGYLSFSGRLVYRVYVDIYAPAGPLRSIPGQEGEPSVSVREWMMLGTRSGTAWVPETGGSQAAGSNPYEKVETSALGRAIGAWGFGVLPGSGIATVEEMAAIAGNQAYQRQARSEGGGGGRESREGLMELTLSSIESYRQIAGMNDAEVMDKVAKFLCERLGIKTSVYDSVKHSVDWSMVKDGQLVMLRGVLGEGIRSLQAAADIGS